MSALFCRVIRHRRIIHATVGRIEGHQCWCGAITQTVRR